MKNFKNISFIFILVLLFSCGTFEKSVKTNKAGSKSDMIKEFSLPNGMKVIVIENPYSKTVAMDIWVNTGSKDEPAEISGVSHFLEHMLFKGTDKRSPGEIDLLIEGVGGVWNAGTAQDFTHFYLTVPADQFDIGLDVLSDVIMNSSLDSEELERERQVILEEYRRKQDSPGGLLYETIYTLTYSSGGYERTIIGTPETINAITREKMLNYYHERYIPKNMVFLISGKVKLDEIKGKIEKTYKDFTRGADFKIPSSGAVVQNFPKSKEIVKQVNDTYLALVFPAPGIETPRETIAMDLLMTILGEGRSSRLYREIKERKQLVSSIDASYPTLKGKSLLMIFATLKAENVELVKKEVLNELKKLSDTTISTEEFNKALKVLKNSYLFGRETNDGIASTIGYYYTLTGSTEYEQNYIKILDDIKKDEIKKLASTLTEDKMNIIKISPEKK